MNKKCGIRLFNDQDMQAVIVCWNKTITPKSFLHPLSEKKIRMVFMERPGFQPESFFVMNDKQGIRSGMAVSKSDDKGEAKLLFYFTKSGRPDNYLQAILDHTSAYLISHGVKKIITGRHAQPDSRDIPAIQFLLENRFYMPCVYDVIIDRNIAMAETLLGQNIEKFFIPNNVFDKQKELEQKGYSFFWYNSQMQGRISFAPTMPFFDTWQHVVNVNSNLEHMYCAEHQGTVIGAAMVSEPFAPSDWVYHGCDCGLFGPTGVEKNHRGGIGTVLLFHTVNRLRELNYSYCMIPTNPSTFLFYYQKAGFKIVRIPLTMVKDIDMQVRRGGDSLPICATGLSGHDQQQGGKL